MSDEEGMFVTSLEVGRIGADSADKYECSPSPGSTALARVHVITEGEKYKKHKHQVWQTLNFVLWFVNDEGHQRGDISIQSSL